MPWGDGLLLLNRFYLLFAKPGTVEVYKISLNLVCNLEYPELSKSQRKTEIRNKIKTCTFPREEAKKLEIKWIL